MADIDQKNLALRADDSALTKALAPSGPVVTNTSSTKALLGTLAGLTTVLVAGSVTLIGFASKHDVLGAYNWIHGDNGIAWLAALVTAGTVAQRLFATAKKHVKLLLAARSASDVIAVVQNETAKLQN